MSASAQIFGRDSAIHKATNILGLGIPSWLDKKFGPKEADDPTLNLDPGQTSTYGAFITRTHGTIGQSGNIIWLEKNKLKAVVKKAKKSGKGGGAPAAGATVTYFATFAVGLCEGPIAGVRRIWVGTNLVYDAGSDDLESIIASNQALKNFKIYLGTDTQAPNSRIQADRGAANTSAYPGLAYIVVTDLALAKYGNSIQGAAIKVEVVNSLTSSGILKSSPTATMPTILGHLQNAPFFSERGAHIWALSDTGTNPTVSRYFLGLDGNISLANQKQITLPYGLSSSISYLPNGQGDQDLLGYPKKTGNGGITLIDTDFNSASYDHIYPAPEANAYHISGGKVYFASAYGFTAVPRLSVADISSGEVLDIPLSAPCQTGQISSLGVVGNSICIGYANKSDWNSEYLFFFDSTTFALIASYSVSSFMPGTMPLRIEFSGGEMFCISTQGTAYKFTEYNSSPELIGSFSSEFSPASSSYLYRVASQDGILFEWLSYYNNAGIGAIYTSEIVDPQQVQLSTIVAAESARSSLIKPADIDTSGMTDSVIGYRVTAAGSIRNALEPLRATYPFDAYQSGYKIRFRSRGTGSVVTIPIGHLIADTQLEESREMDSQLPQRVTVQYLDRDRDYDQNEQSDERLGAESVDEQSVSIQVVMTAAHAKQTAEKLLYLAWLERYSYNFKLPPIYSGLEPSDVITIAAEYANYELRLVSANPDSDGVISCSGVPSNAAIYTSAATADAGQQAQVTIPLAGASVAVLLDIPVVDEAVQNAPGFVAAMTGYAGGWTGGTIVRSADDGQTWEDVQGFGDKGTFGYTQSPLAANAGNLVQRGGSLTVSLLSGFVDSVTEAQMFGGSNTAAYGAPGRWEIIRFQNVTPNPDGSDTLDTFWRGDKGTEWATGLHQAGDLFVLLNDPDNAFIGMSQDSIGQPRTYRAVTFGAEIDSASDIPFTYAGVNLECLSPAHPEGVRDGSANLAASWKRRTRVGGAWRDNVDASLGETSEAYEIDVMSGSTVKRTLISSTQSVIYSAANQITDFGSAQASITLRIYQLSSVVGRGYPLEATF